MIEIDHSVVFRRNDGSGGSGTAIHFTATSLVLEIYDTETAVHLNEVFNRIRISYGRSIMYDGNGIVRRVKDYSSLQIVDFYLLDPWIALSSEDLEADNRFEAERFLELYTLDCHRDPEWSLCFFRFIHLFSQMMAGLKGSRNESTNGLEDGKRAISKKEIALNVMADKLFEYYQEFETCFEECDDQCLDQVDTLFKQLLFPLSRHSKIFRLFHVPTRIPYLNYKKLDSMRKDAFSLSGSLRGSLLDLFFLKFVGVETIRRRCTHFLQETESLLETKAGDVKVLFIGTDFTPLQIVETLSLPLLSRLEIEVTSFFNEPVEEFLDQVSVASATKDISIRLDYYQTRLDSLLKDHFCATGSRLIKYDLICISSMIDILSEKTIPYLVHYLVNHLNDGGTLNLFTAAENPSSVCEHWLQWYTRPLDYTEWDLLMPDTITWKRETLDYGMLVSVHRNENPEQT